MSALAINFWNKCSNACIFCFCKEHDLLTEELVPPSISSLREVGRALIEHKNQCDWVIFSGNEPTLNPDLLVAIMLAKKIGYKVDLRTNGRKLKDRTFCRKLLKVGIDRVNISLLSFDYKTHDLLSNAAGAFDETVAGIKNLVSLWDPKKICIYNVVTKYNYKQLTKSVAFYRDLGVKDIQFNFVYHTDKNITPALSGLESSLQKAIADAIGFGIKVRVYGFPLCFLGKNYKLASELSTSNEVVLGNRITDYETVRTDFGKKKTSFCHDCKLGDICEGTWKSYYGIYGEEEFKDKINEI